MVATQRDVNVCDAAPWSRDMCWGDTVEVDLTQAGKGLRNKHAPSSLRLCQHHYHFELMEWGAAAFLKKYPNAGKSAPEETTLDLREANFPVDVVHHPAVEEFDSHFRFRPPEVLETMVHASMQNSPPGGYHPRKEFEHLKEARIDLNDARLTDKQLTAVCLVFYGGLKKKRAAEVMGISSQALSDHIKAALKKIEARINGS